jgi:nicotinamidase-related amidase
MSDTHANTALLVMDTQAGIVARYVQGEAFFTSMHTALDAARAASIPVIYVVVGFRPGYPEISSRNKMFAVDLAEVI